MITAQEDKGFLGTYLTNNNSFATIFQKSEIVVQTTGAKYIIWVGFIRINNEPVAQKDGILFNVWDSAGLSLNRTSGSIWDLKERVKEKST